MSRGSKCDDGIHCFCNGSCCYCNKLEEVEETVKEVKWNEDEEVYKLVDDFREIMRKRYDETIDKEILNLKKNETLHKASINCKCGTVYLAAVIINTSFLHNSFIGTNEEALNHCPKCDRKYFKILNDSMGNFFNSVRIIDDMEEKVEEGK